MPQLVEVDQSYTNQEALSSLVPTSILPPMALKKIRRKSFQKVFLEHELFYIIVFLVFANKSLQNLHTHDPTAVNVFKKQLLR